MDNMSFAYSFDVDREHQIIYEKIYGIWSKETAENYHRDFVEAVAELTDRPWAKLVDLVNWRTSHPAMVRIVADHLRWCRQHNMALSLNVLNNVSTFRQLNQMFSGGGTRRMSHTFRSREEGVLYMHENWIEKRLWEVSKT